MAGYSEVAPTYFNNKLLLGRVFLIELDKDKRVHEDASDVSWMFCSGLLPRVAHTVHFSGYLYFKNRVFSRVFQIEPKTLAILFSVSCLNCKRCLRRREAIAA